MNTSLVRRLALGALGLAAIWITASAALAAPRPLPTDAASLRRGAAIYMESCATCHGLKGKGDGPVASSYTPPPPDFTKGELRHGSTDEDLVRAIAIGIAGTGMTGFKGRLPDSDIAAVAAYVRSLRK